MKAKLRLNPEFKGGTGSGHRNHAGRPGKRGGSAPGSGGGSMTPSKLAGNIQQYFRDENTHSELDGDTVNFYLLEDVDYDGMDANEYFDFLADKFDAMASEHGLEAKVYYDEGDGEIEGAVSIVPKK